MPGPAKGRRNRRDRERERRRTREAAALTDDERAERAEARESARAAQPAAVSSARGRDAAPIEPPGLGVRITGLMVGIITTLGAAYMVIAGTLNGPGADSILSIGAGVIMLAIGAFVVALVLFPAQIRSFVRHGN